jgi:hypothetical protein
MQDDNIKMITQTRLPVSKYPSHVLITHLPWEYFSSSGTQYSSTSTHILTSFGTTTANMTDINNILLGGSNNSANPPLVDCGRTKKVPALLDVSQIPFYDRPVIEFVHSKNSEYAIIPSNIIPTQSPGALTGVWAQRVYPYFAYLDKSQRDESNQVCATSELVDSNDMNSARFLKWVKEEFVGRSFRLAMMKAFDDKVASAAHNDGFEWNHQVPKTAKHVQNILFSNKILGWLKDGRSHMVMSYLVSWFYCFTFQHGMDYWVESAIMNYFKMNDMRVILGDPTANKTRQHCMIRLAKKFATNSFLTSLRVSCLKLWGRTLEIGVRVGQDEKPPDDSGTYELADLSVYLSPDIMKIIHRNGGAKFWIKHQHPVSRKNDTDVRFRNVIWFGAMGCGMTREQIQSSMTRELNSRFGGPEDNPRGNDQTDLPQCGDRDGARSEPIATSPLERMLPTQNRNEHGTQSLGIAEEGDEVSTKTTMILMSWMNSDAPSYLVILSLE